MQIKDKRYRDREGEVRGETEAKTRFTEIYVRLRPFRGSMSQVRTPRALQRSRLRMWLLVDVLGRALNYTAARGFCRFHLRGTSNNN